MKQETASKVKKALQSKRLLAATVLGLVALVVMFFFLLRPPERSVAAFCKVHAEENAKLPKDASGKGKWTTGRLVSASSDPRNFAQAFGRLERVAPDDIRYDVKALKMAYEKIEQDPSQELAIGLSNLSADNAVKQWVDENCKE